MVGRMHRQRRFGFADLLIYAVLAGLAALYFYPRVKVHFMSQAELYRIEQSASYASCDEARLLGKAPVRRGEPGFRSWMDGDGDGVGCEPHR